MSSRAALFKQQSNRNHEFERYLTLSEANANSAITIDSTRAYVIALPLSYFVSKQGCHRPKGKADAMPFESFRVISVQHRGGNAHSLVLIKSRAIKTNMYNISIFESNGRNGFCGIRILDDHDTSMQNVTRRTPPSPPNTTSTTAQMRTIPGTAAFTASSALSRCAITAAKPVPSGSQNGTNY